MSSGRRPPKGPDLGNREQVRRLKRGMERKASEVVRCQACGHQEPLESAFIGPRTLCARCGAPWHTCRMCKNFDTARRFQCRKPIEAPVADKNAANECTLFAPRGVLDATGRRVEGKAANDSRSLFDSLFKKK